MPGLIKQTLLFMPAQLLGPLFQFIAAIVWTHWLDPAGYGALMLIIAAQELAFQIVFFWWSFYALRYLPSFATAEQKARFARTEAGILFAGSFAQAIGLALSLAVLVPEPSPMLIVVGSLFGLTRSLLNHAAERARAQGQILAYTIAQVAGPVLGFILAYGLLRLVLADSVSILAGYALIQALALVVTWRICAIRLWPGKPDMIMIRAALRYGLPLLASGITTWISLNGIRIVVERFGGAVELGLLSVPWGVGQRVASVAAMLVAAAAFPLAVRLVVSGEKDKALSQLALNGAMLIAILVPTAVGLIVLSEPAVRLMIAEPFQEATMLLLPLVALSGAIRNIRVHYADQVFLLFERSDQAFLVSAGEALLCMAGCVIGYQTGGLWGCVVGCIVGHGLAMLLGFGLAMLGHGLRIPVGDVAKPLLASLIMAGVLKAFVWPAGAMGLGLAVLVGAGVYAIVMAILHASLLLRLIHQKQER